MIHHEKCFWIADNAANGIAERKTETNDHPNDRYQNHADKTLKHGGDNIFFADHATIKESKAGSHNENECSCSKHPCSIGETNLGERRDRCRYSRNEKTQKNDQGQDQKRNES